MKNTKQSPGCVSCAVNPLYDHECTDDARRRRRGNVSRRRFEQRGAQIVHYCSPENDKQPLCGGSGRTEYVVSSVSCVDCARMLAEIDEVFSMSLFGVYRRPSTASRYTPVPGALA